MSAGPDVNARGTWSPDALAVRAAEAGARADRMLRASVDDLFLPEAARLGDRSRSTVRQMLRALIGTIEHALRHHAAGLPGGRERAIPADDRRAFDRLMRSGLLRDDALVTELIARVRQDLIGQALPIAVGSPDMPSLLVQLATAADPGVAQAARQLLAADSRRRAALEQGRMTDADLPASLRPSLIWSVAAAIRMGDDADVDQALVAAVEHRLADAEAEAGAVGGAVGGGGDDAEAAAMALARAIDARIAERPNLLLDARRDRRLGRFVPVIAHGHRLSFEQVRALVLEPDGDRLWLALRALDVDRPIIAQIGLALAEADPARNIDLLADQLDAIAAVPAAAARKALAPLALPGDFRRAIAGLARPSPDRSGRAEGAWR